MAVALVLAAQNGVMLVYLAAGWALVRTGKMSEKGAADIASLLVWLVIPAVILKSFCVERTPERLLELALSAVVAVAALTVACALARALFRRDGVAAFAAAFSNAGFIGVPLVRATLGDDAVFSIAAFIALLNVLQWTLGVSWIRGRRLSFGRSVVLHPIVLATVAGVALFASGLGAHVPSAVLMALDGIAGLNAPLAMLVLGAYLARTSVRALASDGQAWRASAVRLVVIPLATLAMLWAMRLPASMLQALLIAASAPVGANVVVYAGLYDRDAPAASRGVVLSTLLSCATMPALLALVAT